MVESVEVAVSATAPNTAGVVVAVTVQDGRGSQGDSSLGLPYRRRVQSGAGGEGDRAFMGDRSRDHETPENQRPDRTGSTQTSHVLLRVHQGGVAVLRLRCRDP